MKEILTRNLYMKNIRILYVRILHGYFVVNIFVEFQWFLYDKEQ